MSVGLVGGCHHMAPQLAAQLHFPALLLLQCTAWTPPGFRPGVDLRSGSSLGERFLGRLDPEKG